MIEQVVRFEHPHKALWFAAALDDAMVAALYGIEPAVYRDTRAAIAGRVAGAAAELLADQRFADRVDGLPFGRGQTVLALGDSLTDDAQSWLEILGHLLDLRRPGHGINLVNAGISGHTTTQVLGRGMVLTTARPDWVVCLLGSNDVRRTGPEPTKTLVSLDETVRNLAALRQLGRHTPARWVWITPPTFDADRVAAHPAFVQSQLAWRNEDVLAVGDALPAVADPADAVVDVRPAFGNPARPDLVEPDGVHPSLAGQQAIVRTLVEALAR